jgi:hypothetical protein
MPYVGAVSKYNTATPRLAYRQPLSRIAREVPAIYRQPGAQVNFRERKDILRCILTHMSRPEFESTLRRFEESHGENSETEGCTRFPPLEDQKRSTDVHLRKLTVV